MPGSPCQISCAPMPAAAPTLHALPAIIIAGLAPAIHLGAAWTTVTGPVVTTGVKSPRSKTPQPPVDLILSLSKGSDWLQSLQWSDCKEERPERYARRAMVVPSRLPYQSRDSTSPVASASFPTMINAATFYWYFSYPLPAEAIARAS